MRTWEEVFGTTKPVIGMVHLFGWEPCAILNRAIEDIETYYDNGVDAVLVENYGPYSSHEDCAEVLRYLRDNYKGRHYGVNILGDWKEAFAQAWMFGADFIQIDSVCGHLPPDKDHVFASALNKSRRNSDAVVLGGVRFKYQPVLSGRDLPTDIRTAYDRCEAIVVTGEGTGEETPMSKVMEFASVMKKFPLVVGAGVTDKNCQELIKVADGLIVGTWFKDNGIIQDSVSPDRVRRFMELVRRV